MRDHKARKRFGQNFLRDENIVHQIIALIGPAQEDHIVEIGPGLGAMTRALLPNVAKLDAIELDRDLIPILTTNCAQLGNLIIHQSDALKFNFTTLTHFPASLRVVGNLPYNISTPLLFHLFEQRQVIKDMHFMLQKEVAERLAAKPNNKQYGRLTVMAQYYCDIELLLPVPPEAFDPVPKVTSMFLRLIPKAKPTITAKNLKLLDDIVKNAFAMRRKTIRNSLKNWMNTEELLAIGIDPSRRAEELSVENFVRISNIVDAR